MGYEKKDGDVIIFKNDKKSDKQPDYRGTAQIDGKEMKISLWVKDGAKGKFFSGKIELDNFKPKVSNKQEDDSDDLPF